MTERPPIVGVGAGGHARCVIEAIRSTARFRVLGLVDDDPDLRGGRVLGYPVLGGEDALAGLRAGVQLAFVGVGGVGDNRPRRRAFDRLDEAGFRLPAVVHASAVVSPSARLGAGAQVLAGAIVGAEAAVGANALVNAGAIVGHGARVGDHAHVASGARVGGEVTVAEGAHVGSGAVVLQGLRVGGGAVVAAGAVVLADVADGVTVAGVPARPLPRGPEARALWPEGEPLGV